MAYTNIPTRSSADLNAAADINALMGNTDYILGVINPVGVSLSYDGIDIPDNYLAEDGSSLSRTTYATLYAVLTKSLGTVTISIASPGVVTLNSHGLATGDCIELTTSGALPTGLSANTNYYVVYNDANTFWLATTLANAIAGTKINTSGTQSGTHTLRHCPWGIDGANNFLLPDKRGVGEEGAGQQGTAAWASAYYKGGLGHYKQDAMQGHGHRIKYSADAVVNVGGARSNAAGGSTDDGTVTIPVTDGTNGTPRTGYITAGPRVGVKKIIRYQ